ncbi:MAG: DNA cytosine methyltransferase [Myxococcales bacterium]|nr:DNA cytosine methyltransferase [Myxococcales bacterium]
MKLGSLYSGIGGLDLACEWALGTRTTWQLDLVGADIRRRHWPDAFQIEADVAAVDPHDLPRIDVLCAGFACQDLSVAGRGASREDIDAGTRTGPTYRGVLRFVATLRPEVVVLENVPGLLHHRARLEDDLSGYSLTWSRCRAWDAGAPHIRRRVFVVAVMGDRGSRVIDAPTGGRWTPERTWATPTANNPNEGEDPDTWHARRARLAELGTNGNGAGEPLGQQVRLWATPSARDHKTGELSGRHGTEALNQQVTDYPRSPFGSRLSPDWVEALQGFPAGWTLSTGPRLEVDPSPRWPRGRYPADWDRSQLWPGHDWEPPRTLPDGPPCSGRPARLRALGNAVCPQQGALAIRWAQEYAAYSSRSSQRFLFASANHSALLSLTA